MRSINRFNLYLLILFLITTNIFQILLRCNIVTHLEYSYMLYGFGFSSFLTYVIGMIKKKYKFDYFDYLVLVLVLLAFITLEHALNWRVSLFGFVNRNEGLFSILSYYSLFLISRTLNRKQKSIFMKTFLWIGMIHIGFVFFETCYNQLFLHNRYPSSLLGNNNFFGIFCTIGYGLSFELFFKEKKYLIFNLMYLLGILLSGTMSSFLSIIIIFICSFLFHLKRKEEYKKYIVLIGASVICFLVYSIIDHKFILEIYYFFNEVGYSIQHQEIKKEFGNFRIFIWSNTLDVLPQYIYWGAGFDHFSYLFGNMPLYIEELKIYVDKAHNDFLQILICQGIFTLATYLLLYISIIVVNIKKRIHQKEYLTMALLLAMIGYLVQIFFSISIIQIAPIFFIILGCLVTKTTI